MIPARFGCVLTGERQNFGCTYLSNINEHLSCLNHPDQVSRIRVLNDPAH
jgi:hypothetical protein